MSQSILSFLVILFNAFLNCNFVPNQWKAALVVPVFKKGDRSKPNNYRPISLTSCFSRLFELILYKKILEYFLTNNLFSSNQFGFLPNKSTCSQLLSCYYDWCRNFSEKISTQVVYTDIQKAFDSVSHSKLMLILKSYGINIFVLNWIKNFLSNRSQQVIVGSQLSSPCKIASGVPQGSIIGPLLFLIFINPINSCSTPLGSSGSLTLFADDAKVYGTDPNKLQSSLDELSIWLKNHQLTLATHKCAVLHIYKPLSSPSLYLNNSAISSVDNMKDLGIVISQDLKWASHVDHVYKNARKSSFFIIKFAKTKNIWTLLLLYKIYVRSKLEYSTPLWSPSFDKDIVKIEKVQRDFTRIAFKKCGIPYTSYEDRLYKVNLKSLQYRRIFFDIIFMYKILNGLSGLDFNQYFIRRQTPHNLRSNDIKIEPLIRFKDNTWHYSFFNRGPIFWNSIPESLTKIRDLSEFKQKLHNTDLSNLLTFYKK